MENTVAWILKNFDELTVQELYAILQLRNEVFVVEQDCIFQDADDRDQQSHHFMGWQNDKLVAYTRIIAPGINNPAVIIGRVVTSPAYRKKGLGFELMKRSIAAVKNMFGDTAIKIGAQLYLKKFYSSFGFIQTGEIYKEDGIDHIEMILTSPVK